MKKFIAGLFALILVALPFAATGCSNNWKEVQSITYTTNSDSTTLTSTYSWDTTIESIDREEYINTDGHEINYENLYLYFLNPQKMIPDRNELKEYVDKYLGRTFYFYRDDFIEPYYGKITLNSYQLNYVKIRVTKKSIEIDYKNEIKIIYPISYEITYFVN